MAELIYDISRSIVTVEASRSAPAAPGPTGQESVNTLVSSGVVVDTGGFVLTAAAAVVDFDQVLVTFENEVQPAQVVGLDFMTGLALLKTDRPVGSPARISHRHGCAGQMVVAVGNALGLRACPSMGFCAGFRPDGTVQFSTAITPGSIGGGVFDLSGQLLGAITDGLGYGYVAEAALAVPAHTLPTITAYLRARGNREAGYIGVTTADIEITPGLELTQPAQLASANAPARVVDMAPVITRIVAGSPAAAAGLAVGDVVVTVNGREVGSAEELMQLILHQNPGSRVDLGVVRNGSAYSVSIQVGSRRLLPASGYFGRGETADRSTADQESIRRQIEYLRRTLDDLEQQLRR